MTDSIQGDYTAEAKIDVTLPDARSWKELEDYYDNYPRTVRDEVYRAAKLVWAQYRAKLRRLGMKEY